MLEKVQLRITRLLRWSEKYTKTDMVYLARGGSFSFLGQGVGIAASLALAVVVSHLVPKESYGTYKYVLSIVAMLSLFSLNSIGTAVFQSAAQGFDGALRKAFWENIRWSFIVFVGTLMLAAYYFVMGNATIAIGILIGGSLSPFLASANLFGPFLGGKKDFYRQTMYGIFDNITPIAIFIGVVFLTTNPIMLVVTYFITNTLAALYFYRRTIAIYRANMHLHDEKMLTYSKHLSVMGVVSGIANNIDQILLFHFVGAAQLAIYNFALAIPEQIKGPAKNLGAMIQAQFVRRTAKEIGSGMKNKISWFFGVSFFVTAVYIVVAPTIFHLLFPKYMGAVMYSQIFSLWILFLPFDTLYMYLAARKRTKELYINNIFYSILQITTMVIGVLLWGLFGVILARVATRAIMAILYYILYRQAIESEIAGAS